MLLAHYDNEMEATIIESMEKNKHTPGPWVSKEGTTQMIDPRTAIASLWDKVYNSWYIFSESLIHGDRAADAKLIAAAPELLEALLICTGTIDKGPVKFTSEVKLKIANEAIKKATE